MNSHIERLTATGLNKAQATKLISLITSICDSYCSQLSSQNIPQSKWSQCDLPGLTQTLSSISSSSLVQSKELSLSALHNIDKYQLDQIERNLKDEIAGIKSAVQLDISLEQRRNTSNAQEIQRICRECVAYAMLQSKQSTKRLERVEKSAITAICAFAGLLATSFVGYCVFFKDY